MLEDRDNLCRSGRLVSRGSVTTLLIALNVAVFVIQNLVEHLDSFPVYSSFALSVDGLKHGRLWQFLTFQFLHLPLSQGGMFHLMGNLFLIHLVGHPVEKALGPSGFLKLYLLGGTFGGLLQMIGGLFSPGQFGLSVVGASAGTFGLIAAFATLFPHRLVNLFFLPVAIRADVLLSLGVAATLAGLFLPSGHVAHCAHLGGILTGFILARQFLSESRAPAFVKLGPTSALKTTPKPD